MRCYGKGEGSSFTRSIFCQAFPLTLVVTHHSSHHHNVYTITASLTSQMSSPAYHSGPPPLPPRPIAPPTSHRKPVPNLSPFEEFQPSASTASPQPPSLPPRNYQLQPQLSPIQPQFSEKQALPFEKQRWRPYPRTKRGKRWFWIIIAALILIIIAVALIATFVTRNSKSTNDENTASADDNGGHPLSRANGGVDIGKPGDIATYGKGSTDHFRIQVNRSSVVTRLDPIISPGKVSGHVHRFYGSNYVDENLHTASEMAKLGRCSTTAVQDDKSLYWVPQLYHQAANGTLTSVPLGYHAAYYFQKAPTGIPIQPFPDNYHIVAGDPFRREVDPNDR
jgi:hypothetical protein